ncbi:sugar phosphate isomerase/epimerase family protein [Cohnella nanjingensis]|uniref:Sugar phosphate isomerase/epimerase n=1 Tax=Cohnella nanjingensis TaxID=1387779 RepID=A0A7X0VEG2_9BACL|nr:sugar phosphate isomerase/epimerase family protein [Cohnella nanjingensis]MBB6670691.1 sugar phosphate isomerase/epimerase [Cohnella nanjingensis]
MNPKLSIGSWAFAFGPFAASPWSFERILAYAAEAGYDGVEINGFSPHPTPDSYPSRESRVALLEEIRSHGLGISGYAPDFTAAPPDRCEPERYLALFRRYLAFAADLGIGTLRVDTVSPPAELPEAEYEANFARLAGTWRASAELAAAMGIRIAWEFEPGFWLNKPSEVRRLVDAVGHPAFGVLFDTSHAYMCGVVGARQTGEPETLAGGIVAFAKLLEGRIVHFHLIDSDGSLHDEETSTHAAFGAGKIDFAAFLRAVKPNLTVLPWWCVDFCFNAEAEAWGREAIPFIREAIKEAE